MSDDGREARPYCLPEERAAKGRGIVERFAGRFGQAPAEPSGGLAGPRARRRIEQVREGIGRPEARSRGPARHYDITVGTDPTGRHVAAVRFPRRPPQGAMTAHPGAYRLRTNRTDRDEAPCGAPTSPRPTSKRSSAPRIRTRPEAHPPPQAHPGRGPPVRHRRRPPARASDPHPPACGRPPRRSGRPPPDPRRAATRHRRLPARRRTHPACAQGDTIRSPRTAVHDALGIGHAPGGTRRTVVRTRPKRTDVVPLDDPGHHKLMIYINFIMGGKDGLEQDRPHGRTTAQIGVPCRRPDASPHKRCGPTARYRHVRGARRNPSGRAHSRSGPQGNGTPAKRPSPLPTSAGRLSCLGWRAASAPFESWGGSTCSAGF